jgi:hypothetical protein
VKLPALKDGLPGEDFFNFIYLPSTPTKKAGLAGSGPVKEEDIKW